MMQEGGGSTNGCDAASLLLFTKPHVRRAEKGRVQGEDVYVGYGQTVAGGYLVVFFMLKYQTAALPISARDMTQAERRYYAPQRQAR